MHTLEDKKRAEILFKRWRETGSLRRAMDRARVSDGEVRMWREDSQEFEEMFSQVETHMGDDRDQRALDCPTDPVVDHESPPPPSRGLKVRDPGTGAAATMRKRRTTLEGMLSDAATRGRRRGLEVSAADLRVVVVEAQAGTCWFTHEEFDQGEDMPEIVVIEGETRVVQRWVARFLGPEMSPLQLLYYLRGVVHLHEEGSWL